MRRVVVAKPGGYRRLIVEEAPEPAPGIDEIAIQTTACGINFADCAIRMGLYSSARSLHGYPITPGFEFTGTVVGLGDVSPGDDPSVGPRSEGLKVGDKVIGVSLFGGYASHVVVHRRQVFRLPDDFNANAAAGFPAVHLTGWYALRELCNARPGQSLLLHSAAGGVGCATLQIAKKIGLRVVGVVGRPEKVAVAKQFGADEVIDKSSTDLWREAERLQPDGFDIVMDANGRETLLQSYRHTRRPGRLVSYGFSTMLRRGKGTPNWPKLIWDYLRTPRFNPIKLVDANKSIIAFNLSYLFNEHHLLREGLHELLDWRDAGYLVDPPVTTYPLEEVAQAHRDIESGTTTGKLVLVP